MARWTALIVALSTIVPTAAQGPGVGNNMPASGDRAVSVRTATVDGVKLQYLTAGRGPAVVLLHGYAETSRMWRPLMPRLAEHFTVIAPDLPGIGDSDIPKDGLDMKHAAIRIHDLVKGLGIEKAVVVGHDIGLMVAYAYAAQFPAETDKLVLMDAFLPGVDGLGSDLQQSGDLAFSIQRADAGGAGQGTRAHLLRALLERLRRRRDAVHSRGRSASRTRPRTPVQVACARRGPTSCRFRKPPRTSPNSLRPS